MADRVDSQEERDILDVYSEVLQIYKDSFAIWQRDLTQHNNPKGLAGLPEGEVDASDEIALIAVKYKIATKSRTQEYSGYKYKTIPSESKQVLWTLANEKAAGLLKPGFPV